MTILPIHLVAVASVCETLPTEWIGKVSPMRFLSGLVFGILLTITLAYAHDSSVMATTPDGAQQQLVNWEVFGRTVVVARDWLQDQLGRLNAQFRKPN